MNQGRQLRPPEGVKLNFFISTPKFRSMSG